VFTSLFRSPRADSGDRSVFGGFWFSDLGARTAGGVAVTPNSALALSAVFACVRVLAQSFAVMPFTLFQPKEGGGRTRNTGHWLYRLMAKRPNGFQTPYEWRLMLQGHLALRGNAFCQITANGRGEITELLPLSPDRMTVEMLTNGSYRYRYTDQFGRQIYYARNEIWHLRGLSSDGVLGLSPIEVSRESIGEGLAMQAYSSRFFANDAKPGGGYIEYPGKFANKEMKLAFREAWQDMQGGKNRGKVAVLESGMKFHELGLNNADSQFIESRSAKTADIARIFNVPPHKIGDLSKATFSNIEQQSIEFWTDTMLPYAELWESSIEYFLLGPDEPMGLDPEFDMDRMMRGDSAARSAYYASRTQWGSITPNEVRSREGDDPLPGLDSPMMPLNMARIDGSGGVILPDAPDAANAPDEPNEPADESASTRRDNVRAAAEAMHARMRIVLAGNAGRMARRLVGGQAVAASVLADTLAVSEADAAAWLAAVPATSEEEIAASLLALALKGNT
jgi:HK97 family phage portal protein